MHAPGELEDTGQVQRARLEIASGHRRSELTITNSKLFQPPARESNGLSAARVRNKVADRGVRIALNSNISLHYLALLPRPLS